MYFNFMESHIYVGGYPDATNGVFIDYNVVDMMKNAGGDLFFKEYEITETDRRTKTAKFTTPIYLDLTSNFTYVIITSPYHEDFGGIILSIDFDKSTGLYTYQCQDWRRQYSSKLRTIGNEKVSIYQLIEASIISPFTNVVNQVPISDSVRNQFARALSGLHPLNDYYVKASPIMTADNYLARPCPQILGVDTLINSIFNLALYHKNNLDIYFDKYGVIHLDPIDMDSWINTGIHHTGLRNAQDLPGNTTRIQPFRDCSCMAAGCPP